jgi:farnesyl diphosphate synthase
MSREPVQAGLAPRAVSRLKAGPNRPQRAFAGLHVSDSALLAAKAELPGAIAAAAKLVDSALDAVLPQPAGRQARVQQAMRYAIMAGGKRLRPFLVLQSARLFGVDDARSLRVGAAIEALHTYSLVHDDLPCMDDDDLRRGRPTTHIAFDEMTAVLAGDALLTISFEILADARTHPSADVRCALIARLAEASGHSGMIGGQIIDMLAPSFIKEGSFGVDDVIDLQRRKTGQLFEFSCEAGPILGGASAEDRARLKAYAEDMGVVFQITDDLLDVTSTAEKTGKAVGKDADMGKQTLVTLLGLDGARAEAEKRARRAVAALGPHAARAPELSALPFFLLDRDA